MDLLLFGIALTTTHIIGLFVLFILFCVSASYDRRGRTAFKWILLLGSMVGLAVIFRPAVEFSFESVKTLLASIWVPVLTYTIVGLLYSGLEFMLTVRRSVRWVAERWQAHLKLKFSGYTLVPDEANEGKMVRTQVTKTNEEWINAGRLGNASDSDKERAVDVCNEFSNRQSLDFIQFETNKAMLKPEAKVDRLNLSQFIGAWVVFWPFYLVSLILGDLLSEIFQSIANFIAERCGRFVKNAFAGAFNT